MPYRTTFHIALLIVLLTAAAATPQVVFSKLEARSQGSVVVVRWQTAVEEEVASYTLERQTRFDTKFKEVKKFDPQGASKLYEFKDEGVYKTAAEVVQYRLRVTFRDGAIYMTDPPVSVNYSTTAVRRTWGSIKAMFQQ